VALQFLKSDVGEISARAAYDKAINKELFEDLVIQ
jgi:hypothetical protein